MPPLRPTHTCFDDALDYLMMMRRAGNAMHVLERKLWIMHGVCLDPYNDRPIAHAWVHEIGPGSAIQAGIAASGERAWYRLSAAALATIMRPQLVTRYTVSEAIAENARHNTFGPWLPDYIALCGAARCQSCGMSWISPAAAAADAWSHGDGRCVARE